MFILTDFPIDDTEGKLGHGFTSADELEEVDIRPGDRTRPTYVSAKLDPKFKQELISLLKEYNDRFAWEYYEVPSLSKSIVEHRLPIKSRYRLFKQAQEDLDLRCLMILRRKLQSYLKLNSFDHADMQSGSQV